MIQIKSFEFNPFSENTYILYDETKEAIIVDPGCYDQSEKDNLTQFIEDNDLKVVKLINTHCHVDHVFGNKFVKAHFGVELFIHKKDEPTLEAVKVYAPVYGIDKYEPATADKYLDENDHVEFGDSSLDILFVPGHAPGHIVLVHKEQKFCIGGDVLFHGSIGRTDLPGGDFDTLIENIHSKMFKLDDETKVYPGHGPTTTIGFEKANNPFCAVESK
ncbi:MAG: MBL fold metallo-hydrolase [Cyclobacteriaceae bacterium]